MTETTPRSGRRLGLLLWLAGILGVIVITVTVLPHMLGQVGVLPAPLPVLMFAGFAQSSVLLALAVWSGVALAAAVGLHAPAFEAAAAGRPILPALRPQVVPGLVAGLAGGFLLFGVGRSAPPVLLEVQKRFDLPLVARVLYGGITEELLLRWGVMTVFTWLAWRLVQRRRGAVNGGFVWLAIGLSALLFGVGHLPAAVALIGPLDANLVAFVVGVNTVFGVLFGFLYWRYGLEAAMIAHALAHVVGFIANRM